MQKVELQWEGQRNIRRKHRESNEFSSWSAAPLNPDRLIARKSGGVRMPIKPAFVTLGVSFVAILLSLGFLA